MSVLSIQEIYRAARDAGFDPHQAVTWTAIALAESGGRTSALADHGEHSEGLWQINVAGGVRANTFGNLNDPEVNARAAFQISHHGTDMRPWTTTHDSNKGTAHDYRRYLPEVESEIGVQGDPRGVGGYGSPLPPPLFGSDDSAGTAADAGADPAATATDVSPSSDGGAEPAGLPITTAVDTDHDGLTDAFERLVGSNPNVADTDGGGLSDGYEAVVSHTDPLSADTDHDQLSDPAELAAGSDPGRLPGVGGVEGSGQLAYNVRNPGPDSDHDGIPDRIERLVGLDPQSADTDHDGLSDATEIALGTDPTAADSDHDGLSDAFEVRNHLNPLAATGSQTATVPSWTLESALSARTNPAVVDDASTVDAGAGTIDTGAGRIPGSSSDQQSGALHTFLHSAVAQAGDSYVYGATPKLSNPNPTAFDCSSLTQWAADRAGVKLPRIAEDQYRELKAEHKLIPVDEAIKTPGALLFYFSEEPTGPLPAGQAHVAISLGNGKTIEAKGTAYGVGEFPAKGRFNYAAVIPGISDGTGGQAPPSVMDTPTADQFTIDTPAALNEPPTDDLPGAQRNDRDTDHDGLTDAFEKLVGSNPTVADTDHDGISDGREAMITHTDPLSADTDHDGSSDAQELATGSDPGRIAGVGGVEGTGRLAENVRVAQQDSDHDGLSDHLERLLGTNPHAADSDHDGLSDAMEQALGTNPLSADSDSDGLSDGLEVHFHLNPLVANGLGPQASGPDPTGDLHADVGSALDHG